MLAETPVGIERKPKSASRTKRQRKPPEEFVDYIVRIESWGYSLSLNAGRHAVDPYNEFRHLQIRGRLLHPKGLKTDRAEIALLPPCDMLPEARKERQPLEGLAFQCGGHWPSAVFDADPGWLKINICEPCLHRATRRRRVLHGNRAERRSPATYKLWQWPKRQ